MARLKRENERLQEENNLDAIAVSDANGAIAEDIPTNKPAIAPHITTFLQHITKLTIEHQLNKLT